MIEERRFCGMDLKIEERADGDKTSRVLVGYASVFGKKSVDLGGFTEEVAPGTFAETIREDDVVALVDHDPPRVLGRKSAGTLRLSEDKTGLRMEIDIPDTTVGRDLAENVQRGDITGASFGFRTISDEWRMEDGLPHRTLTKVKLRDVGPVTFPAYPDTAVAVRALEQWKQSEVAAVPDLGIYDRKQRLAESVGR